MKTCKLALAVGASLLAWSAGALADPAIYRDNVMRLPAGAVIGPNVREYYADIEMTTDATGKLKINKAKRMPLVYIDSVIPTVVEEEDERSVTLTIAGDKSVPCTELLEPAVSYKNGEFIVLLAEKNVLPAGQACTTVLDPFEIEVELDISKLDAGSYAVEVNGEELEFELETDRPAAG